ncbi:MAG: hypothetical protein L0207_04880 [Chlamydiae bacterium]|nr:hypothetical protein [Chlamydiota bacterium]
MGNAFSGSVNHTTAHSTSIPIPKPAVAYPSWQNTVSWHLFSLASHLTSPICLTREYLVDCYVADILYPDKNRVVLFAIRFFYFAGALYCFTASLFTTLPGVALRYFAILIRQNNFLYAKGEAKEINMLDETFTLLSWNIAGVPAGYSLSDGGVSHWRERIDRIIETILKKDPKVICLYEVFDQLLCDVLIQRLKEKYAHFYFTIGNSSIGTNSGIFIASKFALKDAEFEPFPESMLVGRTKYCRKGVFSFGTGPYRTFATHLQHSEAVGFTTEKEVQARSDQLDLIIEKMKKCQKSILVGDLNFDEIEYRKSQEKYGLYSPLDNATWGGDSLLAKRWGKLPSGPTILDYAIVLKAHNILLDTSRIENNFDCKKFNWKSLSDHSGLYITIEKT